MLLSRITLIAFCGLLAVAGCRKSEPTASPYRTVEFHVRNDDPTGLYVFELNDDHAGTIEDDLQVDVIGHVCQIDKAFLRQSIQTFHHKGKRIGAGVDARGRDITALRVWTVSRSPSSICYYIGTPDQYTALDRSRPHRVGPHMVMFVA
jgi:hypothetical protein